MISLCVNKDQTDVTKSDKNCHTKCHYLMGNQNNLYLSALSPGNAPIEKSGINRIAFTKINHLYLSAMFLFQFIVSRLTAFKA